MHALRKPLRAVTPLVLAVFLTALLPAPAALAGMVGTAEVLAGEQRAELEARIVTYLQRDTVREQLMQQGVDAAEVERRVAALSDREVQSLAERLDELPAGGDLVGAAVVVFLVLLFTDIMGLTDVFPFVNKPARRR